MLEQDISYLEKRIQELEEKVEQLRFSRRVLMSLVEKIEREKGGYVSRLEKENRRLQLNNMKFAHYLFQKNRKIVELESQLTVIYPSEVEN